MGLSEADTRAKLIDPALHDRGWTENLIRREITAAPVIIDEGRARRSPRGARCDYLLRVLVNPEAQPVAVALVEAKPEDAAPGLGLEQCKRYAARFNVPFVFASNGRQYVMYDCRSGLTTKPRSLSRFPMPRDLRAWYEDAEGFSLDDERARPLLQRYPGGEASRYYFQDAAIRAVLEKFARGERRALLSLATGTGKTRIAALLLKKIEEAGRLRRALFVCDRDELRQQGHLQLQNWFGNNAAVASSRNPEMNARIIIATYQTLNIAGDEDDASFLTDNYPEDYFSHIIIDECHRSAWGRWSIVLTRNPNAYQIGLTATPREIISGTMNGRAEDEEISANNVRHFGPPVYEYDLSQGIEDGYLAACEIVRRVVDIDQDGITRDDIAQLTLRLTDAKTGELLRAAEARERYDAPSYEARIQLPDRVDAMCRDLFGHLIATGGPEQKTIIFCVRDTHADAVAAELNNLYARWCKDTGVARRDPYAFKCTASVSGADYIGDLRGLQRSHFIATTVELLTTGVDVPNIRNIVFFKYVRSPIAFYQMVGRGTRIDETTGKLMFRVYDYTEATRLFGHRFITRVSPSHERAEPPGGDRPRERVVRVDDGLEVHISGEGRYIVVNENGRAMPITVDEYRQRIARTLTAEAPSLQEFRRLWIVPDERRSLLRRLPNGPAGARLLQDITDMTEYDLYDVLGDAAYGMSPRTRAGRCQAFGYKNKRWLRTMPAPASGTLEALAAQFTRGGTDALENPHVFDVQEVRRAGGLASLQKLGRPDVILRKTKERLFAA
ncbi:MAG: DEAD/DEAH box helicase family protein [Dehalococcoidia bacterium]|nr:DEAD/DEAH box helicase family protein [Dehalococcoidia bacterium]